MKTKQPLIIVPIALVFVLACQTLLTGEGTDVPSAPTDAPTQDVNFPASPLAGLTYQIHLRDTTTNIQEYWQFGEDGVANKIFEESRVLYGPRFSPDGRKMVYTGFGPGFCTWLVDYDAKTVSPLSCQGEKHVHIVLDWLPSQPDTVLALKGYDVGVGSYIGSPETLSLVDGSFQVLDSTLTYNIISSPDGNNLAYESTDYPPSGMFFSKDMGVRIFNPNEYGVDYPYAGNPVWSPGGDKIAWGLLGDDELDSAIGVFDIEEKTGNILHLFSSGNFNPDMMPGPMPPLASWSPDGKWLALDVCFHKKDQQEWCDSDLSGLWIMSEDGQTENRIDGSFAGWSPDSQWVLSSNDSELRISRLDGSELVLLGKTANEHHDFSPTWNSDGKYLAFTDGQHVLVMETEIWIPKELGPVSKYRDIIWNLDGNGLAFTDENYAIWFAETNTWQAQQLRKIKVSPSSNGNIPSVSLSWHSSLLPAFDTLTKLSPSASEPIPTPASPEPDCSTGVVVTAKDTSKGDYLEVCANDKTYEIGPLAKGVYAVGPNKRFFVYCANNGLVYAVRVGDTRLQPIGDVKDFSAIIRNDVPLFAIEFSGNGTYTVTIRELGYHQNKQITVPKSISAP